MAFALSTSALTNVQARRPAVAASTYLPQICYSIIYMQLWTLQSISMFISTA
jgi:hypothetical protein